MGIDLLTLFWVAFVLIVIGAAALAFGVVAGVIAFFVWCWRAFVERQQRRIRIEHRA